MQLYKQEGYDLVGAALEVYNNLGSGFLEEIYQESLELELKLQGIPFISQPQLNIHYKGYRLEKYYRPDLYAYNGIVVELKAVKELNLIFEAQLLNYLKATQRPVGYLINFGSSEGLQWKRMICT